MSVGASVYFYFSIRTSVHQIKLLIFASNTPFWAFPGYSLCGSTRPLAGHFRFSLLLLSVRDPDSSGYAANPPSSGPVLILSPALKRGNPLDGRAYVANLPICGLLMILCPTLKRWGPSTREELCSQSAHLWATAGWVPSSKA